MFNVYQSFAPVTYSRYGGKGYEPIQNQIHLSSMSRWKRQFAFRKFAFQTSNFGVSWRYIQMGAIVTQNSLYIIQTAKSVGIETTKVEFPNFALWS